MTMTSKNVEYIVPSLYWYGDLIFTVNNIFLDIV
jgi:hypothetical protein